MSIELVDVEVASEFLRIAIYNSILLSRCFGLDFYKK